MAWATRPASAAEGPGSLPNRVRLHYPPVWPTLGAFVRIRNVRMRNFKCFEDETLALHPRFTLVAGDNGSGKTSVLDALAVAAGVWLVELPDSTLLNSRRSILHKEIRLASRQEGDRRQFLECRPVIIDAYGELCGRELSWRRQIREGGTRTTNADAREAVAAIRDHFRRATVGEDVLTPVVAYYGAGRGWLPARDRNRNGRPTKPGAPARRWDAFYDCFEERIRTTDLQYWFQREAVASASRRGRWRPGYEVVKQAVLGCLETADDLWFDGDRSELVVSFGGAGQPFSNLSAGQQMMVSMVADIAIKAVTHNAHLVAEAGGSTDVPSVLEQTPGLILIDELDVHLHPKWQRRVVGDLKDTFPRMQFVCTSHSPFIIQSLDEGELRLLGETELRAEYSDRPIEDIIEDVQDVPCPQRGARAEELSAATGRYFSLLREAGGEVNDDLLEAEARYRRAAERYSRSPGVDAILRLEAMARTGGSEAD